MEFYVGVTGSRTIAGDIAVSLAYFHSKEEIDCEMLLKQMQNYPYYEWDVLRQELSRLAPYYSYKVFKVLVSDVNKYGYTKTVRKAIEDQSALFALSLVKFEDPTLILSCVDQPSTRYYPFKRIEPDCYTFLARVLSYLYFKEQILIEHQSYPMYKWDKNSGVPTKEHVLALLTHGPVYHLHKKTSVLNYAKYLYKRVLRRDPEVKHLVRYLCNPPPWWEMQYKNEDYFACINKSKGLIPHVLSNYHNRFYTKEVESLYKYVLNEEIFDANLIE